MPLADIETQICQFVARRFLENHEATPRDDLLSEFKTNLSTPLQNLTSRFVIYPTMYIAGSETFLPKAVAFHYSQDSTALSLARGSKEVVLMAIRNLFDHQLRTRNKEPLTPKDVLVQAQKIDPSVQADMIWLGLYFSREFSVFAMTQPEADQVGIAAFRPHEYIYDLVRADGFWDQHIQEGIKSVEQTWRQEAHNELVQHQVEFGGGIFTDEVGPERRESRKVFLVHGSDKAVLEEVSAFLKSLNLDVVILYKQPNRGRTVIEKFEKHSDVGFAVVLLTPDDVGEPVSEPQKKAKRARQNVILELGYFIAKLGRERVCPLQVGEVELPSDIHGVVYVPYDRDQEWRLKLAQEIQESRISVDVAGVIAKLESGGYASETMVDRGDMTAAIHPQPSSSRRDRSAKGAKTPRRFQPSKPWDLWLGFDGAGQSAMLSLQNRGPETIFNVTVKIPEDGSSFKSQPISRSEPGGLIYACPPGLYDKIRDAIAVAIMSGRAKPEAESLPVRSSCAVVVDAKDDQAKAFYQKYGFLELPGIPNRLLLPMATIEQMK